MLAWRKKVFIFMGIVCYVDATMILKTSTKFDEFEKGNNSKHQVNETLSQAQLAEIFKTAKDISHSKGKLVKSQDGDLEYRRSFKKKVSLQVNTKILETILDKLIASDSSAFLALQDLEYLVHEYDVALEFVNLRGIEEVLHFLKHPDKIIKSKALSVLTAAMQGNPYVQEYVADLPFLQYLLSSLLSFEEDPLPGLFYALSSFLRNMPNSQLNFFRQKGIQILADMLKMAKVPLKLKLKIIDLFNDIAVEILHEMDPVHMNRTYELKRLFAGAIHETDVCNNISEYLVTEDYQVLEKVVTSMNNLYPFCLAQFESENVYHQVKHLMDVYNPISKDKWYSKLDPDLKAELFESLKTLYIRIKDIKLKEKTEL